MKTLLLVFPLLAIIATGGCAWYDITPISTADTQKWATGKNGYVIYQPELYFAATVTSSATGTNKTDSAKADITVAPVYLPNPDKAYRVSTHNFLGKSDFTFNFENGWKLTAIADKADNTTVANTLAGELQTALKAAGIASAIKGSTTPQVRVILFRPVYQNGMIVSFKQVGAMEPTTVQ